MHPGRHRPQARIGDDALAEEGRLVDVRRVDGIRDRAAKIDVVHRRNVLVEHQDRGHGRAFHLLHRETGIGEKGVHIPVGHIGDVDLAGPERRGEHGLVLDHLDGDLVQVRQLVAVLVLAPVVLIADEIDETAGDDLLELERPRARRIPAVILRQLGEGRRRAHRAAAVGQQSETGRPWAVQVEAHLVVIQHVDGFDGEEAGSRRRLVRRVEHAVDVLLHRVRVEWRSVVERHVRPQSEGDRGRRVGDFPRRRERCGGIGIPGLVGVHQLVEHLPPVIGVAAGPARGRIERRRFEREADGEMPAIVRLLLRRRARPGQRRPQRESETNADRPLFQAGHCHVLPVAAVGGCPPLSDFGSKHTTSS